MPRLQKGHKFILCIIDEMTNYLITVLIYHSRSEEVGEALIEHVISKYCAPDSIIMDQDSTFMSTLMNYLFRKLNIKIKTIATYNHQSLMNSNELLIQEVKYKDQDRSSIQSSIFTSRMWHQIIV